MAEGRKFSNREVVKLLESVAAALNLMKASIFQVRAYEAAADGIEHSSAEVKDLWEDKKLDQIPGVGENIEKYLDELFRTGEVKHFESIKSKFPEVIYELIEIPGIGPKTALELANLGVKDLQDLEKKIKNGELIDRGFSSKIAEKIMSGLEEIDGRDKGRMLLPYAFAQAEKILLYMRKAPGIRDIQPLGSLRRMVVTVGDLDFAASADDGESIVKYFTQMPGVARILDQGDNKGSVMLNSGVRVDLLVGKPDAFGALLQHFTGSKLHNIKLRTLAEKKGLSLSEYGVKKVKSPARGPLRSEASEARQRRQNPKVKSMEVLQCKTEEDLYKLLGMDVPPPEIREDTGEIEAALRQAQGKPGGLPRLVEFSEIKGDLHLHSNFPLEPSHGPGANEIEDIIKKARELGYQYVGISDHPPGFTTHSRGQIIELIEKRTKVIQKIKQGTKSIRVFNGLEVDILGDGSLSVPDEALETLDYCIAGIHSGHRGAKEDLTRRIIKALENPNVDIIAHPSGRLLNERDSFEANWEEIFKVCAKYKKILEINAYPNRLDLRDDLVREAQKYGVKFIINTDAHEVSQMENMRFGVSVARRGWASGKDVVNTWEWDEIKKWFNLRD